jgi:hypothetical protein
MTIKGYQIRKWFTQVEDTLENETGQAADGAPLRKIVIAAAIRNPYAGKFARRVRTGDSTRQAPFDQLILHQ